MLRYWIEFERKYITGLNCHTICDSNVGHNEFPVHIFVYAIKSWKWGYCAATNDIWSQIELHCSKKHLPFK